MRLFHRTPRGTEILRTGFRDGHGTYLTGQEWTGVWLADRPLDENEGASGDDLLVVEMPTELVTPYEWVEVGKPYREFRVPAAVVNRHPVRVAHDDDW